MRDKKNQQAIALDNEWGDREQLAVTIAHQGIASMQRGDDEEAIAYLNRAIELRANVKDAVNWRSP